MVLVSRRAAPPHLGQVVFTHDSIAARGDSPVPLGYVNEIGRGAATREDVITLVKLIGPFAPHFADEAWETLGQKGFVIEAAWPQYTDALATGAEVTLAIQVNGKLRGTMHIARNVSDEALRAHALALPTVAKHVENRVIKSIRIVPEKVVSIVTE